MELAAAVPIVSLRITEPLRFCSRLCFSTGVDPYSAPKRPETELPMDWGERLRKAPDNSLSDDIRNSRRGCDICTDTHKFTQTHTVTVLLTLTVA